MQIKPSTAGDYGVRDPRMLLDPRVNKDVGSRFFSDLLRHYKGDVGKALEAYNSGRGRVDKGRIPASALAYAGKVEGRLPGARSSATSEGSKSAPTVGSQTPRFSPSIMQDAPSGTGEGLRDRLMRIFSPASASAAETSNVKEIPSVGPAADIDTRIRAKLADRRAGTTAPLPADVDARIAAKIGASGLGVPIPPGAVIGGASARKGTVPIPPGATIGTKPSPSLPLAVRAADWLPTVGQIGGELGGGALGIESGPGDIAAIGAGGGLGEGLGAEADTGVRTAYGLPHKTQSEILKDAGISGAISAVGVPAGKVLSKVGEVIAPSMLKAAIAARRGYDASREAFDATMKKISDALGLDAKAAAVASASPLERRQVRAAFLGARQAGFDQAGKVYQDISKSYVGRMTPNASAIGYTNFSSKYGARSLSLLDNGIDFTRPSWRMIQQFRSNVRKMMRHLPPDSGNMASDLRRLERTATSDLKAIMTPEDSRRLDLIDQWNADIHSNLPDSMVRAVVTAPNAPKAIEAIIKSEPSQVDTLLRGIDRLPMADRVKKLTVLKKATGEWIHDQAASGKDLVQKLAKYDAALNSIPEPAMNRLYGPGTKEAMHKAIQATIQFHRRMLKEPYLITAIQAEMKRRPLPWIVQHGRWVAFGAVVGVFAGRATGSEGLGLVFGFTPEVMHVLLNNPLAQRLYVKAVTGQSPKAIAEGFRALLTALASQQMRGPIEGPDEIAATPAA